jgi:hypothetical protein
MLMTAIELLIMVAVLAIGAYFLWIYVGRDPKEPVGQWLLRLRYHWRQTIFAIALFAACVVAALLILGRNLP